MKIISAIFALAALAGCSQQDSDLFGSPAGMSQTQLRGIMMQTMVLGQRPGEYTFFPNDEESLLDRPGKSFDLLIKTDESNQVKDGKNYLCSNFRVLVVTMDNNGHYLLPYRRSSNMMNQEGNVTTYQNADKALPDFKPQTLLNLAPMITDNNDARRPYVLFDQKNSEPFCALLSPR